MTTLKIARVALQTKKVGHPCSNVSQTCNTSQDLEI